MASVLFNFGQVEEKYVINMARHNLTFNNSHQEINRNRRVTTYPNYRNAQTRWFTH
jgi:hypothetical protein